jgi:uncharacterized protein DUF5317
MVLLNFVAGGLVIGLLLGGTLRQLGQLRIRVLWLAYLAIALQVAAFPSGVLPWSMPGGVASALWLASYGTLGTFIVVNREVAGLAVVGVGQACNVVAIVANGGLMPVTRGALRDAGLEYRLRNNSISAVHPHLSWFVDRWAVPTWLPFGNVYSVGDVIIGIGVLLAIVVAMRPRLLSPRGERSDRLETDLTVSARGAGAYGGPADTRERAPVG